MCFIGCALTPDYAVMAADSARYENDAMSFQTPKLMKLGEKHLVTCIGTAMYLEQIKSLMFLEDIDVVSNYLEDHFQRQRSMVEETLEREKIPAHFCLYLLGVKEGKPTLVEFNSFLDFKVKYKTCSVGVEFATLFYGDDDNKEKQMIFQESALFMELTAKKYDPITPGLLGEILTRGIYHKADLEEKTGDKRKYAGGVVTVGMIDKSGLITGLSNLVS